MFLCLIFFTVVFALLFVCFMIVFFCYCCLFFSDVNIIFCLCITVCSIIIFNLDNEITVLY